MHKHRSIYSITLSAFLLSGCFASIPPGMPTAMIRFKSNVSTIVAPACLADRSYVFNGLIRVSTSSEVSPVKMLGTRTDKNNEVIERLIPAERNIAFLVSGSTGTPGAKTFLNCRIIFGFRPGAGEQFELDYVMQGETCRATLSSLSGTEGAIKHAVIQPVHYKNQGNPCD